MTVPLFLRGSVLTAIAFIASGPTMLAAPPGGDAPIRIAISERAIRGVNLNDARAAINLWGNQIITGAGLNTTRERDWVHSSEAIIAGIRSGTFDLMCLSVEEFLIVRDLVESSDIVTDSRRGRELVLLVRSDSPFNSLASLRGHSLLQLDSAETQLADIWMDAELRRAGLPAVPLHFGVRTRHSKLSQVILPLFFGRAEAALVTREGLETMVEMNPQLGKHLRVLAFSPRLLATFLVARKGIADSVRHRIFENILASKSDPATRQVLTLFHVQGYVRCNQACIQPSIQLLEAHQRSAKP